MDTTFTCVPECGVIKGQWWENQFDTGGYHRIKQVQFITMKGMVVLEGANKIMVPHYVPLLDFISKWKLICPVEIRPYQQPLESSPRFQILTRHPWYSPSDRRSGSISRTCVGEIITYTDRMKKNV